MLRRRAARSSIQAKKLAVYCVELPRDMVENLAKFTRTAFSNFFARRAQYPKFNKTAFNWKDGQVSSAKRTELIARQRVKTTACRMYAHNHHSQTWPLWTEEQLLSFELETGINCTKTQKEKQLKPAQYYALKSLIYLPIEPQTS